MLNQILGCASTTGAGDEGGEGQVEKRPVQFEKPTFVGQAGRRDGSEQLNVKVAAQFRCDRIAAPERMVERRDILRKTC